VFFVPASYRTERSEGYVAEFCEICRKPQRFEVFRIGAAATSFGAGREVGHVLRCDTCHLSKPADGSAYTVFLRSPGCAVEDLIPVTTPNLLEELATRLEVEHAIVSGQLDSLDHETRRNLLLEPFRFLNWELARGQSLSQTNEYWNVIVLGGIVAGAGGFFLLRNLNNARSTRMIVGGVCVAAVVAVAAIWSARTERKRIRTRVIPNLVHALRPLRPTREEITDCLRRCSDAKLLIGRKLKPEALFEVLDSPPAVN
jgi:hypothetical protein